MNIDTASDWWKAVDANWSRLLRLITDWHPSSKSAEPRPRLRIDAPYAETACRDIREEIHDDAHDPVAAAMKAHIDRDGPALWSIFNATWFGVPESRGAHGLPGFGLLCDLCSEGGVLEEGDQEAIERAPCEPLTTFTFTPEILEGLADLPQPPDDYYDIGGSE